MAAAYDVSDGHLAQVAAEPRSTVTFDLEPVGDLVKLTVVHGGFAAQAVLPALARAGRR